MTGTNDSASSTLRMNTLTVLEMNNLRVMEPPVFD
jgi:hypothetical protein